MPHGSPHNPEDQPGYKPNVRPPAGFTAELYPLRHKFAYSAGLSAVTATMNSTMFTLVKNYKSSDNPDTVNVNPHHASFVTETGAICAPMSIIDKLRLTLKFNLTKQGYTSDAITNLSMWWQPIFFSFPEKLDAADDVSTDTVAALLSLTKDATEEDITPAFATKLPTDGASDAPNPASTVNFTEVFGTMNLSVDTTPEGVPHDDDTLMKAFRYYTNKGALKACLGKRRNFRLTGTKTEQSFHINKFVPKAIRRIVPYTFFAILVHVPLASEKEQYYYSHAITASKAQVGCKALITYDEWNSDHLQEMM